MPKVLTASMTTYFSCHYTQGSSPIALLELLSEVTSVFLVAESTDLFSVLILSVTSLQYTRTLINLYFLKSPFLCLSLLSLFFIPFPFLRC